MNIDFDILIGGSAEVIDSPELIVHGGWGGGLI